MVRMYGKVRIEFGEKPDAYYGDVKDECRIDCGDMSEERLEAFIADTSRKIRKAWEYLRGREEVIGSTGL